MAAMNRRSGCSPLGCLWRTFLTLLVLAGLAVLAVVAAVLVVRLSPGPGVGRTAELPGPSVCAVLSARLDRNDPGTQELLHAVDDSLVKPALERTLAASHPWLQPLVEPLHWLLSQALPGAAGQVLVDISPDSAPALVWVVDSRVPTRVLEFLNWPARRSGASVRLHAAELPLRRLGAKTCVLHDNWMLVSRSVPALQRLLDGLGESAADPALAAALRRSGRTAGTARFVLDNRRQSLVRALDALELDLLNRSRPAEREVVTHLFALSRSSASQVRQATGSGRLVTGNALEFEANLTATGPAAARQLRDLLETVRPFLAASSRLPEKGRGEADGEPGVSLLYQSELKDCEVRLKGQLTGVRAQVLRSLREFLAPTRHIN
jgi:hypothetical protein